MNSNRLMGEYLGAAKDRDSTTVARDNNSENFEEEPDSKGEEPPVSSKLIQEHINPTRSTAIALTIKSDQLGNSSSSDDEAPQLDTEQMVEIDV